MSSLTQTVCFRRFSNSATSLCVSDDEDCPACEEALHSLETIDDDIDELDILFVKIKDPRYARKYGVKNLPSLTYFRKRFPAIYHGTFFK
ncbi:hypothetical protein AVEN_75971-1 [Araneus ventricosus]|uniref:Thioredoxin domain-containing protein n=1 Tax=Araneus ventricosus TaxID=182803 RepID=A0A4Y2NBG8_ARAVE|nr:hypothetical protein AVEN_65459-1 [Araneus ventricosus]GBN35998.1 hypothetical protein AVEN_117533-1 [Araneus ventricosus]GBN36152.1 hypothetical protein AVEN_36743-1 [Araneus ventricosus]GBN36183.1 hypothetical protein AVEN_75971-1 [Araneus ventricosus]